jgi:protein TonB
MRGRDWIIGSGALVASLLLHGLLFFNAGSVAGNTEQVKPKQSTTRVSFRSVAAPPTVPQPQQPVAEKPPEPEVTEAPQPPPKPEPPKPEKRAEKARQPEQEVKPSSPEQAPPPAATTSETEKAPSAAEVVQGSVEDPALIEQARQEYLRRLMAHIEAHKHYPRAARRRGIQGDVKVSFTLKAAGRAEGLTAVGGHRLLNSAASDAVRDAQPLPPPPDLIKLPWPVNFTMRFTLR